MAPTDEVLVSALTTVLDGYRKWMSRVSSDFEKLPADDSEGHPNRDVLELFYEKHFRAMLNNSMMLDQAKSWIIFFRATGFKSAKVCPLKIVRILCCVQLNIVLR